MLQKTRRLSERSSVLLAAEGDSVPATSDNSTEAEQKPAAACVGTGDTPARLCKSSFNTTAPMYGVSLTSGKPVTIVQIFPDLLQQVVYETCEYGNTKYKVIEL